VAGEPDWGLIPVAAGHSLLRGCRSRGMQMLRHEPPFGTAPAKRMVAFQRMHARDSIAIITARNCGRESRLDMPWQSCQ
jgi:hypothetical protein